MPGDSGGGDGDGDGDGSGLMGYREFLSSCFLSFLSFFLSCLCSAGVPLD